MQQQTTSQSIGIDSLFSNNQKQSSFFSNNLNQQKSKSRVKSIINKKLFKDVQILCPNGQKGYGYCIDCQNCSVMCLEQQQCQCYQIHKNCQNYKRITTFNNALEVKVKNSQILQRISEIIQTMIDQLCQFQQTIKRKFQFFGLNKADKLISQKIIKYTKNQQKINSKDFIKYLQDHQKEQLAWFNQQTTYFKQLKNKVNQSLTDHLNQINENIFYEHMSKTKNINNIIFTDSVILNENKNHQPLLFDYCKDLGPLSYAKRIFTTEKHQFTLKQFYQKCLGKKNLLYLVRNENYKTYGGFCPVTVQQKFNDYYVDQTNQTFIFDLDQKLKSKLLKNDKTLKIYSPDANDGKYQNEQFFLSFGESQYPHLVISQNSKKYTKYNYICFQNQNSSNKYFQDKRVSGHDNDSSSYYDRRVYEGYNSNRRCYRCKIKYFEIYQVFFKSNS